MIWKKYDRSFRIEILFLFFACLSAMNSSSQTITYSDTLIKELEPQKDESDDSTYSREENYFLNKDNRPGQTDSFHLRKLPAAELKKLKDDDAFWYADANIKKKVEKAESGTSFISQSWFQTLLWLIIVAGFVAFIMIYLANSNVVLFRRKNKSLKETMEEKDETDNIFLINYQKEIDKAIQNGNYRFAVRLLFLRLLRKLSDKNIIQYKQGRTNFDYLLQLSPTSYYKDFFRITRNYEYSWYGHFDVNPETFDIIRKDVESFEKNIK